MLTPTIERAAVVGDTLELSVIGLSPGAPPSVRVGQETLAVRSHNSTHVLTDAPRCPGSAAAPVELYVPGMGYALSLGLDLTQAGSGFGETVAALVGPTNPAGYGACAPPPPPASPPSSPPPLPSLPLSIDATNVSVANWSSQFAWGGLPPPAEGDTAIIPRGRHVFLDVSPPRLQLLLVQGSLEFARTDLHLQANYIFVAQGASFTVGTEQRPFMQRATITLHGTPVTAELPVYGAKVLACRECILDLHGKPTLRSWTRLAATANAGETALLLLEPVDWEVGSEIVVTSTSDEMHEAEVRVLAALEVGGTRLVLTSPLTHEHLGVSFDIDGHTVEMRAEVGLLSHNVVVQGDTTSTASQVSASPPSVTLPTTLLTGSPQHLRTHAVRRRHACASPRSLVAR
jgi:hypothetical protein